MVAKSLSVRSNTLLRSSLRLQKTSGGAKTDPRKMPMIGDIGFRTALEKSLAHNGIFSRNGKFSLAARIVSVDVKNLARKRGTFNFSVTVSVHYSVLNEETKREVFNEIVSASSQAYSNQIYFGDRNASRQLQIIQERAMKQNIENFIVALDRKFLASEK